MTEPLELVALSPRITTHERSHELRVIARLMVEKAPVIFEAQDAAKLRKAAGELEDMRAIMDQSASSHIQLSAPSARRSWLLSIDIKSNECWLTPFGTRVMRQR
jgi:hypothetical protein